MKYNGWNQYPDLYSRDNTKYTFYHDDRTKVTYVAGIDGITEEWIAKIREAHRAEVNNDRRGRSKGEGHNKLLSLTMFEELDDKSVVLIDHDTDIEGDYIAEEERAEQSRLLKLAMASLTEEQRELFLKVNWYGINITEIAAQEGVTRQAVQNRLAKIKKKLEQYRF